MSPDEARKKYYGLGPIPGGSAVYSQQQNFSLAALARRDADDPFSKPEPAPAATAPDEDAEMDDEEIKSLAFIHANFALYTKDQPESAR